MSANERNQEQLLRTRGLVIALAFGVLLPAFTLGLEWYSRICASFYVDPIPTIWHALLIALVPVANFLACIELRWRRGWSPAMLCWLNGLALGVAIYYAVVFLPMSPFAAIAVVFLGIGLVPLSPLISLIVAIVLRRKLRRLAPQGNRDWLPAAWRGIAAAFVAVSLLTAPRVVAVVGMQMAAHGKQDTQVRGLRLLRRFASKDALLSACYEQRGVADVTALLYRWWGRPVTTADARAVYYRVTGKPYNAVTPPRIHRIGRSAEFDADQGGEQVAGQVEGLSLQVSKLDSTVDADGGTSYTEWTLVFQNDSEVQREARMQIALPPGAVASRLTLWVNGEPREAAFGKRSQVRNAYQRVVARKRDPVLVTTSGPDQILVQCFPVPPKGGTLKTRVGITAPLVLESEAQGLVRLPYLVERNFALAETGVVGTSGPARPGTTQRVVPANGGAGDGTGVVGTSGPARPGTTQPFDSAQGRRVVPTGHVLGSPAGGFAHSVWIESKRPLGVVSVAGRMPVEHPADNVYAVRGRLTDAELERGFAIRATRDAALQEVWARPQGATGGPVICGRIRAEQSTPPRRVVVVVDGSKPMGRHKDGIAQAVRDLPEDIEFAVLLAGDEVETLCPVQPGAAGARTAAADRVRAERFVGGRDNVPALLAAWDLAAEQPNSAILWLHATQPIELLNTEELLQRWKRRPGGPVLYDLQFDAGPNRIAERLDGISAVTRVPRLAGPEADLQRLLAHWRGDARNVAFELRREAEPVGAEVSSHLARLWAHREVLRLAASGAEPDRQKAVDLSMEYQIVTPVSGAVVLESEQQYQEAGLKPVSKSSVPGVTPEPETWVTILVGGALLLAVRARAARGSWRAVAGSGSGSRPWELACFSGAGCADRPTPPCGHPSQGGESEGNRESPPWRVLRSPKGEGGRGREGWVVRGSSDTKQGGR